ncbi:hypothetical protein B0H17DRAFT_1210062 [Mycena rosella]|uniref:Uncharacterized protein n=1 Tax=Mycena rosella TaxID=1033263 RepID=A0AAD7G5G3_MYCRO|nr:hypothetical protein B0H17DRAFT_1210062 [Mycena rosella]
MSSLKERPYTADDLTDLNKAALSDIIRNQIAKWPESSFNPSKITKAQLIDGILTNGFSINVETLSIQSQDSPSAHPNIPESDRDSAHPESPPPPQFRSLDLLIEDLRVQPANTFIQTILLESAGDSELGEWLIDGSALLQALQSFPSALDGPVKLASEDPSDPAWKRYFVKISGPEKLKDASTTPAQLKITGGSRLRIFVERSEGQIGKAVKKASIETALFMAATSLAEAEKMVKLVAKFGEG